MKMTPRADFAAADGTDESDAADSQFVADYPDL